MTNRKSYSGSRLPSRSMTLDDLERKNRGFMDFFDDFGLRHSFQEQQHSREMVAPSGICKYIVPNVSCWIIKLRFVRKHAPLLHLPLCVTWAFLVYSLICLRTILSCTNFVNECAFTHSLIHSFVYLCINSFICLFTHSFIYLLFLLTHSLIHSFIHSFIHSLTHSLIDWLIHLFTHSCTDSLNHSFICW